MNKISMSFISRLYKTALFQVIRREINRYCDSRVLPFSTLIAPALSFLLIIWIFSGGVIVDLPVAVIDNDNSAMSRIAERAIDASPVANVIKITSVYEARLLMEEGKTDAIVVIEKDFEKNILKSQNPGIAVFINNTNVVKGGALKSGIYKSLETISTGIKIQSYLRTGSNTQQAFAKAQPIRLDSHILFNPFGNYSYFLVLALLPLMVNVFTFLGSVYAIGIEIKEGTAGKWFNTANKNITTAIIGKMFPYTLLFMLNVMLMNLLLFKVLDTPITGSLFIVIISEILLIITYQILAILFIAITVNMRLSLSIGSAYTMMALTFSGLTFPTFAMPIIAKMFSMIFPYTFWLKIFLSQTLRGEPLFETLVPFISLTIFILIGFLAFPKMRKILSNKKYWYRK
jgi:ABC-2 type transport system permease protein